MEEIYVSLDHLFSNHYTHALLTVLQNSILAAFPDVMNIHVDNDTINKTSDSSGCMYKLIILSYIDIVGDGWDVKGDGYPLRTTYILLYFHCFKH